MDHHAGVHIGEAFSLMMKNTAMLVTFEKERPTGLRRGVLALRKISKGKKKIKQNNSSLKAVSYVPLVCIIGGRWTLKDNRQFSLTIADVTTGPREIARASLPSMCEFVCQNKTLVE